MSEPDLVLLHAPSIYDFRQEAILYGPIADFAPAPFSFEISPLGYASLAEYLERAGYSVRIMNLAKHMLDDALFDAEEAIRALNPVAFGIDFHWLTHAQGALAVAQIVKTLHPETPLIMGGFAASYYHRELIGYPQVDYVLRGDSTEEPLAHLMECLSLGRVPDAVPGLTWRTHSGHVVENPLGLPLASLDCLALGNGKASYYQKDHPVSVGVMARGCTNNCLTCGGSAYAYQHIHGRQTPAYRSPESLARDLYNMCAYDDCSVYVPCDITQPGMDYAYRFLQAMRGFPKPVCLDLLQPLPRKFLQDITEALPSLTLQFTMDSHDPHIRQAMGKNYSNLALEQTMADALMLGCQRVDIHFTIGLPCQDYDSVMATVAYCDDLLTQLGDDGRLQPFIAPLIPFLDPGSIAFEEPEPNGYRLQFHTLEEHRRALLAPTWKYMLNYETEWMTGDDIVRATYDATVAMARLRAKHGLIPDDDAEALECLVSKTCQLMGQIEHVMAMDNFDQLQDKLRALKPEIDKVNQAGPWNNYLVVPEGRYTRRPAGSRHGRKPGGPQKVWGILKNWLGRGRYHPPEQATDTYLHHSDTGQQTSGSGTIS